MRSRESTLSEILEIKNGEKLESIFQKFKSKLSRHSTNANYCLFAQVLFMRVRLIFSYCEKMDVIIVYICKK